MTQPASEGNGSTLPGEALGWRRAKSSVLLDTPWYRMRRDQGTLPTEDEYEYTYMEHAGGVCVIPITPEGRLVLLRHYRYPVDRWCWELPAGSMGDRADMDPEGVARQELAEEAGATCEELESLGKYYLAVGVASYPVHFYIAHGVVVNQPPSREVTEVIDRVETVSLEEAVAMVLQRRLISVESAFGIMLANSLLNARPRKAK